MPPGILQLEGEVLARINIEDCWWIDPRRSKLIKLVGDEAKADGEAIKMWRIAQEYWKHGRGLVPKEVFESLEVSSKLIEAGLAKIEDEEWVYVKGSSQYLDWTHEQKLKQSAGGKKSAETRKRKYGSAQPLKKPAKRRSPVEVESKSIEVSGSGSLSVSGSKEEYIKIRQREDFEALGRLYLNLFPNTTFGNAWPRFSKQITSLEKAKALGDAIPRYKAAVDHDNQEKAWRSPKKTFATFLGTETSGYYWEDYIAHEAPRPLSKGGYASVS